MADTQTTNLNLTKPEPGAAEDTWGISLNADLDALDAIFSSTGTQVNLNPNQINFADNKKAVFGAGSDLQIYHDGSNSYIKDVGTGNLIIEGSSQLKLTGPAGDYFMGQNNGSAYLYHAGSLKAYTTSTGIDVTGTVVSDGLEARKDTSATTNSLLKLTNSAGSTTDGVGITLEVANTSGSGGSLNVVRDGSNFKPYMTLNTSSSVSAAPSQRVRIDDTGIDVTGTVTTDGLILDANTGLYGTDATLSNYSSSNGVYLNGNIGGWLRLNGDRTGHQRWDIYGNNGGGYARLLTNNKNRLDVANNGDISFYDDAGSSAAFFWDASEERLGIGTTAPTNPLTVVGADSMAIGDYIVHYGDSNTKIGFPSNDKFKIRVAGSDIANVTSTGLGIGTDNPSEKLEIASNSSVNMKLNNTGQNISLQIGAQASAARITAGSGDRLGLGAGNTQDILNIDTSGNVLVGKTASDFTVAGHEMKPSSFAAFTRNGGTPLIVNRLSSDGAIIEFYQGTSSVGSISVTSSATTYNTSSDARLKDVTGEARGLEVINELNPVSYNWKADGKADEGLIAQEVQEIVPNAVSGSEEEHYQMDYSKLVVHLVKAVKEQQEQIESLKGEIANLKGE